MGYTMAQIDVMMPAYTAAGTIGAAIASLQRQTHADLRIMVVDDGSSDGTATVLDEIAREDGRIVVLRQENQGIVGARNTALAATASAYVTQLDADDLSEPDRVERLAAHLDAHAGCVAVSGAARHIDRGGRPMGTFARFPPPVEAHAAWVPAREPLVMPFSMWRRSALERIGGYRPTGLASDTDLALAIAGPGRRDESRPRGWLLPRARKRDRGLDRERPGASGVLAVDRRVGPAAGAWLG